MRVFVSCIKRTALTPAGGTPSPREFSLYQKLNTQGFLTQVDHVLGPEGGVTVEADGAVGSRDGVTASLQDVPQLEGDLRANRNSLLLTEKHRMRNQCVLRPWSTNKDWQQQPGRVSICQENPPLYNSSL